uniref:Barrel-sandwich domain of CusB or HlyD membrane-fusion n=1 Tax=Candidatus Kentrum sp. FW TaxID=2126338 RepID=A0A450SIM7_9GAMM|nr:MAG: Barrel-sandwich domain of CusB or HlyD membrane-fusion [Candidatus Kentron sp. FW]VFJ55691.1 MAG: Barrel-sandwich domain of CusB or HlyD membrane-fusion [Candidatus Kentron sp. FW]
MSLIAASFLLLFAQAGWGADIGALCILTPRPGILELSAPMDALVSEIPVHPNQRVRAGDLLISFSDRALLEQKLTALETEIDWHEKTRHARIDVQETILAGAERSVREATERLKNYEALPKNARSAREWRERRYALASARHEVALEATRLARMRLEDEARARELREKRKIAVIELAAGTLRAPMDGTVLAVHKQVGESAGGDVAVTLANLQEMAARCEVFEGDLLKLHPGMKARVSGGALPRPMGGVIGWISRQVHRNNKVAEIIVHLDEAEPANRLVGMEVDVTIMDIQ